MRAGLRCERSFFFPGLSWLSPACPHLQSGLPGRLEMGSNRNAVARTDLGRRRLRRKPAWRGSHPPRRPRGVGGGEGGKYTVAKGRWKGIGRFYKFLNFMTMLNSGMSTQSVAKLAQKTCTGHIKYRMKCCSEYLLAKI